MNKIVKEGVGEDAAWWMGFGVGVSAGMLLAFALVWLK